MFYQNITKFKAFLGFVFDVGIKHVHSCLVIALKTYYKIGTALEFQCPNASI